MRKGMLKFVFFAVLAIVQAGAGTAQAVDPPKWVAAIFIQNQNSVGLRWGAVPGATGFKVLRSITKGADYKEIASVTPPQAFDAAVEPGTTYYYVLQAVAGAEVSANSDERAVMIPGSKRVALVAPEMEPPIVQATTEFGKTTFRVGFTWRVVSGAVAYNLYKSTESGKNYQLLVSGAENRTVDTAVEEGKTYYYVVAALDDQFQETPYSKEVTASPKAEIKVEKKKVKAETELVVQPTKVVRILGRSDTGMDPLNNPAGVAVAPNGVTYVTDTAAHRIRMYDAKGAFVKIFGQLGDGTLPGDLQEPSNVVFFDDRVFVVCAGLGLVQVFKEDGTPLSAIPVQDPENPQKQFLTAMAIRSDGTIFVSLGGKNLVIAEINDKGVIQRRFSDVQLYSGVKAKYAGAAFMAFGPDDNLYAASTPNFSVHVFNKEGENTLTWGQPGDVAGKFLRPAGVAIDKEDRVFVTDVATGNIQAFNGKTGDFLFSLGAEKEGESLNVSTPLGIAFGPDRLLYITEGLNRQVVVLQEVGQPYKIDLAKKKH